MKYDNDEDEKLPLLPKIVIAIVLGDATLSLPANSGGGGGGIAPYFTIALIVDKLINRKK